MARVEADIAAGLPAAALAERHYPFLMHWSEERLRAAIVMLRDAEIGPFAADRGGAGRSADEREPDADPFLGPLNFRSPR